jgi:hypothetical protein
MVIGQGGEAVSLRLIPFPKEVVLDKGGFVLDQRLRVEAAAGQLGLLGGQINAELARARLKPAQLKASKAAGYSLRLVGAKAPKAQPLRLREGAGPEDYALEVRPWGVTICAQGEPGLFYGAQTLRQLIRANQQANQLPGLTIRDWPSIRWRAFQDDLTRGPSSTLANLRTQAELGAFFKLNIFTYYMEYQYAFSKHPVIGPKDGSLTPAELKALVARAQPLHLNILGNQQSFGHFTAILAHPEYAPLRETPYLLCPANEQTYQLLDDLYSEVVPLLPFPFFNVCCDETEGLGQGPSKPLADKLGVGGLYVQHIKRIHDLVQGKYGKRMMMWGDIILRHPDHLGELPKDTVMLTWGYDARPSFEDQIIPFAKSGYEFFVCPGVNCWSRVLPHFSMATTNIRNFVRDGAKHGALGVLNTTWDDDGESFNAPNWHGSAWGAECAWNAAATTPEDFNRRLGAVLFGERGDHFGRAIASLSAPEVCGLPNAEFWKNEFEQKASDPEAERQQWEKWLTPARAAMEHLEACQAEAAANAELLDYFMFGARRIEVCAQRRLDRLEALAAYASALKAGPGEAATQIAKAQAPLRRSRAALEGLQKRFAELWLRENKPYALDWTLNRYRDALARYDAILTQLDEAGAAAQAGRPLPAPQAIGLEPAER